MAPDRLPAAPEDWRALFARYAEIVLVANSDAADIAAISARHPGECLFVFFNKVYKVLSEPFRRPSILVARSSGAGANIVYRREVKTVTALLAPPGFAGILNLKAGDDERFSAAEDFAGRPVGFLDLAPHLRTFYPESHVASSGFALALWLTEQALPGRLYLAGFTATRSEAWKVFHVHDWTFEQVVQRLLVRKLKLFIDGEGLSTTSMAAIAGRFPDVDAGEIALVASEVLSERLEGANVAIDGLISLTKLQRRLDKALRSLKPKTRKAKLADAKGAGAG